MSVKTKEDAENGRGTRPSSPRRFFARLYGHLETREDKSNSEKKRPPLVGKIISNSETIDVFPTESSGGRIIGCGKVYQTDSEFHRKQLSVSVSVSSSENRLNLPSNKKESLSVSLSVEEITKARLSMFREASVPFLPIVYPRLPTTALVVPSGQPTHLGYEKFSHFNNEIEGHLNGFSAFFARRRRRETRPRRQRTTFSGQQTACLEFEYRRGEYISRGRRFELAESLSLTETQIKIWFQNRRAKDKRIEKARLDQHYRNIALSNGLLPIPVYAGVTADLCDLSFYKDTMYTDDCHIVMPGEEPACPTSVTRENEESGGGDSITSSRSYRSSRSSSSSNSRSGGVTEDVS